MHDPGNIIKLLLVDDELEFLDATSRALGRRGFAVQTAENGRRALELLLAEPFDAVVLDVKMPGPDGVEIFRRIKHRDPDLPVIMLTGHGTLQQAFETSREGIYDYLTKPCDVEHLAALVTRAVAERRQTEGVAVEGDEQAPIRLLLVDDELDLLQAMAPALQRREMQVTTALGTTEALEEIERQAFDVAVIDLRMPGADGIELLKHIGARRPLTQVILLTGQPSMDKMIDAVRERAFAFLVKPQSVEALTKKIREAFAQRGQRAQEIQQQRAQEALDEYPD